jgi:hypothetical protein
VSKGLGKLQRGILAALEAHPAVWLRDLLPKDCARSQYQALYRAAHSLSDTGKIGIWHGGFSHSPLVLARIGYAVNRTDIPRLSVESVPAENQVNTYEQAKQ